MIEIERIVSRRTLPLQGQILGYSEKGAKLEIAVLNVEGDKVRECEFLKFFSPHEVVAFFAERPKPLGFGTADTLALGMGREGWRPADFWINEAPFHYECPHDEFPFYWGPFQLDGRRSLAAIALLSALRRRWPDLPATETAPEECYNHLTRSAGYPTLEERSATLGGWLSGKLPADISEPDWDAAMSAYAMWMGLRG